MFIEKRPVIYVGYDSREHEAYEVLRKSIQRYNTKYDIIPLVQPALRRAGLYRRTIRFDSNAESITRIDEFDGRPFSSDFTFTRFLVPALNQYDGLALFMDADMFIRWDIEELFNTYGKREEYAVQVVKHNYRPNEGLKMDGQVQQNYNRKNWSSFVLWNCSHPSNLNLTVDDVNTKSGSWLHGFSWLSNDEIGSIEPEWNWLDGWSPENIVPKNVHFTTGGPWFEDWEGKRKSDTEYAGEWQAFKSKVFMDKLVGEVL